MSDSSLSPSDVRRLLTHWQSLLLSFRALFTGPGWVCFALWITALVLCDERHTLTQCLISLGLQDLWRKAEAFLEYGVWDIRALENRLLALIETRQRPRFAGYRPLAVDDTFELRDSREVWGVCTYAHHTGRQVKQPKLFRGHNWVVLGSLQPGRPWRYLPAAARLYVRQSQCPEDQVFATHGQLAGELLRQARCIAPDEPILALVDGGYAQDQIVQACRSGDEGQAGAFLTRPRCDARLYAPLEPTPGKPVGRRRIWGPRLPAPKDHEQWQSPWQSSQAWIYGRLRSFRYKRLECRWHVSGPELPVAVYVLEVEGYTKPWFLITNALELTAEQVAEAYAARFRQEEGFREHKQLLGMQEVRAWTKHPILRTFAAQMAAISLLRLWQQQVEAEDLAVYPPTPWNRHKQWGSLLDLRRLCWSCRAAFSKFCRDLDELPISRLPAA